jgi:TRAP transporter TAXI family solute receptor
MASCASPAAAPPPPPRPLALWSGIAPEFSSGVVASLNARVQAVTASLRLASGGVEVVSAIERHAADVGFAQSDVVYLAYRRGIERQAYPHRNLRGLAVMWVNNLYVLVRKDSPVRRLEDLRGRRVGFIAPGTSGEFAARILLKAHELQYTDFRPTFQYSDQLLARLIRDELDGVVVAGPTMSRALLQAHETRPLRLIPIGRPALERLRREYPFLKPVVLDPGQLPGQDEPVATVGADWLMVCRRDLPEPVAYAVTKAFIEGLPGLAEANAEASLIDPDEAATAPIPMHPGAARYYREREILR